MVEKPAENQTELLKDAYTGIVSDCGLVIQSHRLRQQRKQKVKVRKLNYQNRFLIRWLEKNKNRWEDEVDIFSSGKLLVIRVTTERYRNKTDVSESIHGSGI